MRGLLTRTARSPAGAPRPHSYPIDAVRRCTAAPVRQVKRLPSRIWGPPENAPRPREELVARLSDVLSIQARPDPGTAALAALVAACGLSGKLFPGVGGQVRERRLAEISVGQWPAAAVRVSVRAAVAKLPFQILWAFKDIGDLLP